MSGGTRTPSKTSIMQELGSEIVPFLCHSVSFIITIAYSSMVYIFFIYPGILEKLGVANVLLNHDILKKNRPCTRLGTPCPSLCE